MKKHLFGYFNRKILVFVHFAVFDNLDMLIDYDSALRELYLCGKYTDYTFSDFTLYPEDYTIYDVGLLDYNPCHPTDCFNYEFYVCGDLFDLISKKESVDNAKRVDSDDFDSEPVYASQSPRS